MNAKEGSMKHKILIVDDEESIREFLEIMLKKEEIKLKGIHIPVIPEIYNPVLDELEKVGVKFEEEYNLSLSNVLF